MVVDSSAVASIFLRRRGYQRLLEALAGARPQVRPRGAPGEGRVQAQAQEEHVRLGLREGELAAVELVRLLLLEARQRRQGLGWGGAAAQADLDED